MTHAAALTYQFTLKSRVIFFNHFLVARKTTCTQNHLLCLDHHFAVLCLTDRTADTGFFIFKQSFTLGACENAHAFFFADSFQIADDAMPHILFSLCNMKNLRCLVRDMMHHVAEFNPSVHQPIDGIPTLVDQCTDNPAVNLPMGIIHTIPENLISVRKNKLLALYLAVHTKNASREKAVSAHRRIRFRNRYLCTHLCCCHSRRHAGRAAADNQNLCIQFHLKTSCDPFHFPALLLKMHQLIAI